MMGGCGARAPWPPLPFQVRVSTPKRSLRPSRRGDDRKGCDLNDYVVATVEFPMCDRWHLDGHQAQAEYLFPPAALDDTLNRLSRGAVTKSLREAERRYRLKEHALGDISVIAQATRGSLRLSRKPGCGVFTRHWASAHVYAKYDAPEERRNALDAWGR